ncbi:MAG: histidine phosphatase family protein [Oscillospiraceae bacterium]|nr:histidine phosphatase family protein [Oscillospiraceae bacterium]
MTVYFVRHGQTEKNRAMRLQGRSDHPMDETGVVQAAAAGEFFRSNGIRFDAVFSSPLLRAIQTAKLIAGEDLPVQADDRLIEMDYGPYEGMDLRTPAPEVLAFFRDFAHTPAPAGMEQLDDVVKRLGVFLEETAPLCPDQNILVSTHAIAMKAALEYLTPESLGSYWSKYIGNCAVYRAEYKDGVFSIPAEIYAG